MKIVMLQNNQLYKDKLYQYLTAVDKDFNPVLSSKIDLKQYTERIVEKAKICCALSDEDNIIGVVAFYANDFEKQYAYIPLVSVSAEYRRQGIARKLMEEVLSFIKSLNVTLNLAMDEQFIIHTPLMWIDKAGTWALADELGVLDIIRNETLTCYNGIPGDGCGHCPACTLRNAGLKKCLSEKNRLDNNI